MFNVGEILGLVGLVGVGCIELVEMFYGLCILCGGCIMLNGKEINKLFIGECLLCGLVYLLEDCQLFGLNFDVLLVWNVCVFIYNFCGFWVKIVKDNVILECYCWVLNIKFN